jgi:hypothetical protein
MSLCNSFGECGPALTVHHPLETHYEIVMDESQLSYRGSTLVTDPLNLPMHYYLGN